jgi:hypothetical protein
MTYRKKLIEVALPLDAILYVCTFGKGGSRKGHHVVSRKKHNA